MIAFMIMRCLSNNISYMHVNSRKGRVLQQSAVQCEYLVVGADTGRLGERRERARKMGE